MLAYMIRDAFADDRQVDPDSLGVAVRSGVVTLSGWSPNLAMREAAVAAAGRIRAVRCVVDEIRIFGSAADKGRDERIADRVRKMFALDAAIPTDAFEVSVVHGCVALSGIAERAYQRHAARRAAARVGGVVAIANRIDVAPQTAPAAILPSLTGTPHNSSLRS